MAITCCYKCPDRHSTCHATCPKYLKEKNEHDKLMEKIRQQKLLEASTFHLINVEHAGHRRKY